MILKNKDEKIFKKPPRSFDTKNFNLKTFSKME